MTKLQKDAWVNLIVSAVGVIVGIITLNILRRLKGAGLESVIIGIVAGGLASLICVLLWKSTEAGFDEREKMINRKAYIWSTYVLTLYAVLVCFIAFFTIGATGSIPVFYLPVFLLVGLFVAQLTQSSIILVLSAQEQADERR